MISLIRHFLKTKKFHKTLEYYNFHHFLLKDRNFVHWRAGVIYYFGSQTCKFFKFRVILRFINVIFDDSSDLPITLTCLLFKAETFDVFISYINSIYVFVWGPAYFSTPTFPNISQHRLSYWLATFQGHFLATHWTPYHAIVDFWTKNLLEILPLRFTKARRVMCGGARETHWATCQNGVTSSKTKGFL